MKTPYHSPVTRGFRAKYHIRPEIPAPPSPIRFWFVTLLCQCLDKNAFMALFAATFIVRLDRSGARPWTGVVECVRTGEKRRVVDIEALGRLIAQMVPEESGPGLMKSVSNGPQPRQMHSDSRHRPKR
jgi:hypothetical protein